MVKQGKVLCSPKYSCLVCMRGAKLPLNVSESPQNTKIPPLIFAFPAEKCIIP